MPKILLIIFLLAACATITPPADFRYREIETGTFKLASWQKINDPQKPYKIYIEGDGHAFKSGGRPSANPTPHDDFMRRVAFGDPSPNVIYLARPCQYVTDPLCSPRHWTTARFAPEVINAEFAAAQQIAGNKPVILIGFSGGAQVAGLIATAKLGLNVQQMVTIAGNLDHLAWTQYHRLPPLNESMSLADYRTQYLQIPQIHFVGDQDTVIPPALVKEFIGDKDVIIVENAKHNQGFDNALPQVWKIN